MLYRWFGNLSKQIVKLTSKPISFLLIFAQIITQPRHNFIIYLYRTANLVLRRVGVKGGGVAQVANHSRGGEGVLEASVACAAMPGL